MLEVLHVVAVVSGRIGAGAVARQMISSYAKKMPVMVDESGSFPFPIQLLFSPATTNVSMEEEA